MLYKKITGAFQIARHHGIGFCAFRAKYNLKMKLGLLRRKCPAKKWAEIKLNQRIKPGLISRQIDILRVHETNGRQFFFDSTRLPKLSGCSSEKICADAKMILQNKFRYFFNTDYDLGPGPDWLLNPATGKRANNDLHWSHIDSFDPAVGDIKFIWEPSRFGWVYTLVRAYAATGENKYADKFWSLFESWIEQNQPNTGPNYACGQECAIRLMAMCFAAYALSYANASTDQRKIKLVTAIAVHAERIEKNIDFAIHTGTNHSLTEAAGLYTAGMLFPELKRSDYWLRLGKKIFTNEGLKQINHDGSYIQYSMNYHRLMLQDCLWVIRLGQLNSDSFCQKIVSRVEKAVEFLYQMQDENSGRVPNYGTNDGSLILPLNSCDYLDYRPVIQSCWYLLKREKLYENGPWDEDLLWLFGPEAIKLSVTSKERKSMEFANGGYYTVRSKNSWSMTRCHSYRSRILHFDSMHLDLWADGMNLLRDCGTYQYFASDEPQLEQYFKSIWSHNTVIVDDASPLRLASRFMWLPWPKAKLLKFEIRGDHTNWEGEHLAYNRFPWHVIHCRKVVAEHDQWEIVDQLRGEGRHELELRWHLPDEVEVVCRQPHLLRLRLPGQWRMEVSDSEEIKSELLHSQLNGGYESLYYGQKRPIYTLSVKKYSQLPATFRTIVRKA